MKEIEERRRDEYQQREKKNPKEKVEWAERAGNGRTVRISILFTRDIPQSQGRGSENRIG